MSSCQSYLVSVLEDDMSAFKHSGVMLWAWYFNLFQLKFLDLDEVTLGTTSHKLQSHAILVYS